MLDKWLKYIVYAGVFGLILTPFIVTQGLFFPFVTGKNFFFRIVVAIIFFAWTILAVRDRKYRPQKSYILWAFFALLVSMGISDLLSPNIEKSFWSNFERMEGWITLLHLFGYFIVASTVLNTKRIWEWFLNLSVGGSIVMVGYSLLQIFGVLTINQGGVRVDGTFGNAAYLASYMLFHVFITGFLLSQRISSNRERTGKSMDWLTWLYIPAIFLQGMILYMTATRGTILGLLGGAFLTLALVALLEKENKRLRKWSAGIFIALLLVVGGFFLVKDSAFVENSLTLNRLASISLTEPTTQSRFVVWGMAIEGFKEKPVFGWGQESFNYVFNQNYDPRMYNQEQWFDRAHNVFFDWLVTGGALGLILYLSLFFFALYYIWKKTQEDMSVVSKSVLTGLLAGYFAHNFFVFDNIVSYLLFFTVLAMITYYKVDRKEDESPVKVNGSFENSIAPAVALVLMIISIYAFNVNGIRASNTLLDGLRFIAQGNFDIGLTTMQKAAAFDNYGVQEIREQLSQTATRMASDNIPLATKQKYFDTTVEEMLKQIEKDPENARIEVFLGALYSRYGSTDDALMHLERALELSPNKQNIMMEIGANYLNKGEIQKALDITEKAHLLDEGFELPRFFYAMMNIYAGNNTKVEELLVPIYGTVAVPNDLFVKAYLDTGQLMRVVEVREAQVLENPNDIQQRIFLAAAYNEAGLKQQAIAVLEEIKTAAPNTAAQIDAFISQVRAGQRF